MVNNKTTYVLEIDAEVKQLKSKLDDTRAALDKIGESSFSTSFNKKLVSIFNQLDKLSKKASQPIDSKTTFINLEKGFNNIALEAKSLIEELDKISKLSTKEKFSILPKEEAARFKEALEAIEAYTKAVERAEKTRIRTQEKRKTDLETTKTSLNKAKASKDEAKLAYSNATAKDTDYGKAKALLSQADAAKKAQREIDQLEKQLKKYQKRLGELNKIEQRSDDQNKELDSVRSSIHSTAGKIGARTKIVKNAPDEKALKNAEKVVAQQAPVIEQMAQQVTTAEKEVTRLELALEKLKEAIKNNSAQITSSQADYKILYEQANKLGISLAGVTEEANPKNIELLTNRLNELVIQGIAPTEQAIQEMAPDLENLGNIAQETGNQIATASERFGAMSENRNRINNIETNIKQFIGWAGATKVLSAAIRNAFNDIKDLDAVMTEIAVVTDFDIGDMWEQMPQYTERANELGLAITEIYEASALYYQQGLDTNEMVALSNETLKMAKIAGLDAADATDRMTAALRGFNMELNEVSAQKVADVYSELAAITASNVNEISSAMTKTASIASSAGMEFETTAAFLSQIIETTRESAQTAGTAMKTVIARFQELKKSPDEIGEIDGEIVDANAIEGALRSVGVSLRDTSGQFRDLDDVFLELSSKWDGLDKNTQRYIATIAAGSRQQSRFIAMMQDYERTQELVTAANNSAGASQKQYEKTLDSIKTKLTELRNAWTEFSTGLLNNDLVKFAIDFLTKILNVINKVTQGFEGFTGSLSKIGTMIAIFQTVKVVLTKFWDQIVIETVKSVQKAMEGMNTKVKEGTEKTKQDVENILSKDSTTAPAQEDQKWIDKTKGKIKEKFAGTQIAKSRRKILDANAGIDSAKSNLRTAQDQLTQVSDSYHSENIGLEKRQIQIKKDKAVLKNSIKNEKDRYRVSQAQRVINELDEEQLELIKKKNALSAKYSKEEKKNKAAIIKAEKELQTAQENAVKTSKEALNEMAVSAQKTGQAIATIGVGIGLVGQMFEEAGNSDAAEFFTKVGNIFTFVGSAIMGVAAIIPAFTTIFGGLVAKMVAGGISVQMAWWWVALIAAAVIGLIVGVVALFDAIKKASPEGQLKKAEEAADKASEAADRATESYENLRDTLESLGEQYKTLENLTKGTKEWNDAIVKVNNSVLDLIEKYPELAQFVTQGDGYLEIDINSDEVQAVLKKAQLSAILSKNTAALANAKVVSAENAVKKKNYKITGENADQISSSLAKGELVVKNNQLVAGSKSLDELGYTQSMLDNFYQQNGEDFSTIRRYGDALITEESSYKAAYSAIALAAQQAANVNSFTAQEKAIVSNLVDFNDVAKDYQRTLSYIDFIDYKDKSLDEKKKAERDQAIKQIYGEDAKIEDLTNEQIQAAIAQSRSVQSTSTAIEQIPAMLKDFSQKNSDEMASMVTNLLMNFEGKELSMQDYNKLTSLTDDELKQIYKDMGAIGKKVLGSEQDFLDSTKKTKDIVIAQNKQMQTSMEKMFGTGATIPDWNLSPELGAQLLSKFSNIFDTADPVAFQEFYSAFGELLSRVPEDQQKIFAGIFESIDWTDTTSLNTLPDKLAQAGISLDQLGMDLYDFIDTTIDASNAIAKLSTEELTKTLNNIQDLIRNVNKGEQSRTISEEQYSNLLAADPALRKEFVKTSDGYMYLGNSMMDLRDAILDNTSALRGEDSETAAAMGEIFEGMSSISIQQEQQQINAKRFKELDELISGEAANLEYAQNMADYERSQILEDTFWNNFLDELEAFYWSFFRSADGSFMPVTNQEHAMVAAEWDEIATTARTNLEAYVQEQKALESDKDRVGYLEFNADNLPQLPIKQMREYIDTLANTTENGKFKYDVRSLGIQDLYNGIDVTKLGENELRNLISQLLIKQSNAAYYEKIAEATPEVKLGKEISYAVLGGSKTLKEWYQEQMQLAVGAEGKLSDIDRDTVLKGSLIKLASDYGISENRYKNFFDESGKLISGKFDEFIDMLEEFEEREYNRTYEENRSSLINQVKDALVAEREKEIDALENNFNAIVDANNKVVDAIQKWIDEDRQRRQNEETEKELEDKYSQLAYLGMSSTGTELDILQLEKETKDLEQEYQDSRVDQAIQQLQDANDKAAEQRDTQIEIARQQLEAYKNSMELLIEAQNVVNEGIYVVKSGGNIESTRLGELLSPEDNATDYEKDNYYNELEDTLGSMPDDFIPKELVEEKPVVMPTKPIITTIIPKDTIEIPGNGNIITNPYTNTAIMSAGLGGMKKQQFLMSMHAYSTGGLADFTGPAWLDGTKSRPEYVLNSTQTERFFSLIDILDKYELGEKTDKNGDNYYDIEINVEKLENDYDVEKVADKIRRMIYEDASYRNVNAINHIR